MGLGDILGDVWGGLGDLFKGAESTSVPTQLPTMSPEQMALLKTLLGQTQTGLGVPTPSYPGQLYTPANVLEQSYLTSAQMTPEQTAARETALQSILSGYTDPAARERYYTESLDRKSVV